MALWMKEETEGNQSLLVVRQTMSAFNKASAPSPNRSWRR